MSQLSETECRAQIVDIARMMYDRRLLESAGGNLSARAADGSILISPRYSGSRLRWQLQSDMIMRMSPAGDIIEGDGSLSREVQMHLAIYERFPECGGICHAHPYNILVFACSGRPLPPTSEQTDKYGTVPVTPFAPAHSAELAKIVVETLEPQRERLAKHAIACILNRHGMTVAGRDLPDAYDCLERLDGSAKIWIDRAALEIADRLRGTDDRNSV